jgi:hypothetical protein
MTISSSNPSGLVGFLPSHRLSGMTQIAYSGIFGIVSSTVLCCVLLGVWWQFASATSPVWFWAAGAVASVALTQRYAHRPIPKSNTSLYIILCVFISAGFGWVLMFDSIQGSDFGVYYRCGQHFSIPIETWAKSCQSAYMSTNSIFWIRSLFYSVPLLGGGTLDYTALKLGNAALHALALLAVTKAVYEHHGSRSASVTALALGLNPEWWYSLTLASSDNIAVPAIAIALLFFAMQPRSGRYYWSGVGVGLVLFIGGSARTMLPLIYAFTLALLFLLPLKFCQLRAARIPAIVLATLFLASGVLTQLGPKSVPSNSGGLLAVPSSLDLNSAQDFSINYAWYEHYIPAIPKSNRSAVMWAQFVQESATGWGQYPYYLYKKGQTLFAADGYIFFASADLRDNPDTYRTVEKATVPVSKHSPTLQKGLMTFLLLMTVWGIINTVSRSCTLGIVAVAWCFTFFAAILGFGEPQSRYLTLLAPAFAVLAGIAVSLPSNNSNWLGSKKLLTLPIGIILVTIFWCGMYLMFHMLTQPHPWQFKVPAHSKSVGGEACNITPPITETYLARLKIRPVPASGCIYAELVWPAHTRSGSMFIAVDQFPYPFETHLGPAYRFSLIENNAIVASGDFRYKPAYWVAVPSVQNYNADRQFQLLIEPLARNKESKVPTISWRPLAR